MSLLTGNIDASIFGRMTYDQLIEYFGTQQAAADAIGIKQPSVAEWKENGIPIPRQAQYELATDGNLRAERPVRIESAVK